MTVLRIKDALEAAYQELQVQRDSQYLNIPSLMGGVGIGKTEGAQSLCVRMAHETNDQIMFESIATGEAGDPTDTVGVPWVINVNPNDAVNEKEFKVLWALNRAAWQACQIPTMLLFDDIDKASRLVTSALLKLFVERRFKDYKLHPLSLMMCAGNRSSDDQHANELSESLKTRITVIETEANVDDLVEWAMTAPDPTTPYIHPMLLGWLPGRPELVHKVDAGVYRFPTPRGYREATLHMYRQPETKWKPILQRKIGEAATNDFFIWYNIYRKIDVDHILDKGVLNGTIGPQTDGNGNKVPAEVSQKLGEFASVFAVVERLNREIRKDHAGLERWILSLSPELKVAFKLQLNKQATNIFDQSYKTAAGAIMGSIIKGAGP